MKHEVFWKNPGYKIRPELKEDIVCEYLIVGGGVTGVSLAYFLNKLGAKNIVLIEKNYIASGATGKAAGTLCAHAELDLYELIQKFGKHKGTRYWNESIKALQLIRETIKKEKISCEFENLNEFFGAYQHKTKDDPLEEYVY